jgi:chromosome segregation ATPase
VKEWQARFRTSCDESTSLKASGAEVDTRVHLAEEAARVWRLKCEEALLRIESLESKLAEASRDVQLRRTQLCATVAELEKWKAEQMCNDMRKEKATEASQTARLASARAAQAEAESERAVAVAKAEVAAAKAEQARAEREAQQAVWKCNQARASLESDRAKWSAVREDEEDRLAQLQKSLSDQQNDVKRRAGLLEGLEMERQKVASKENSWKRKARSCNWRREEFTTQSSDRDLLPCYPKAPLRRFRVCPRCTINMPKNPLVNKGPGALLSCGKTRVDPPWYSRKASTQFHAELGAGHPVAHVMHPLSGQDTYSRRLRR